MTEYNFNFNDSNPQNQMPKNAFGKELFFDINQIRRKSNRDKSFAKLFKSPIIMVSSSGLSSSHKKNCFSKMRFLSSDPNELCDREKFLLQEKQAENNSNMINEEKFSLADKLIECKCICRKQHNFLLLD